VRQTTGLHPPGQRAANPKFAQALGHSETKFGFKSGSQGYACSLSIPKFARVRRS